MLSLLYVPTLTSIHDYGKNHSFISPFVGKLMSLLYNTLSRFVIQVLKFWLFNICLLIALETLLIETKSREMAS